MKAYELLFFVDPSIDEETRLATSKRIDTAITEQGGKVSNVEDWGKRKLAVRDQRSCRRRLHSHRFRG